jgi:helicase
MLDTNSTRLFSGEVLEKIENADAISRLPLKARDIILKVVMEFFTCDCGVPYCEHPPQKISRMMIDLRMSGLSPKQIYNHFSRDYDLMLYSGDVFSYLDQIVHKLEAVERIAIATRNGKTSELARSYIRRIEG